MSPTGGAVDQPPLRWLLLASHVPPGASLGGIVRYTVELARALADRDDVELHVTAAPAAVRSLVPLVGSPERVHPVARAGVPGPLLDRWGPVPGGRGATGAGGFDVVHGAKHLLPSRRAAGGAQRVLTVHDMILLDRPGDFPAAKRTVLRRPYRRALRGADVLLCVSAATRERLCAWEPGSAARAAVTPLASSPALLDGAAATVPELADLAARGRPFALVVGDPTPRKNVALVVRAWAQVAAQRPDAVLALVGPPSWGASDYGEEAGPLERAGRLVRLTGVPDAQLRWAYEHAAVALCPSLVEGFGLPVVEALDLGTPVVVSADPALVEAAAGRAAAVLPADDAGAWARQVLALLPGPGASSPVRVTAAATAAARPRSWGDVAADTVAAVRRGLDALS